MWFSTSILSKHQTENFCERDQISVQESVMRKLHMCCIPYKRGFPAMLLAVAEPLEESCSRARRVLWSRLVLNNYIWIKVDFMIKSRILSEQTSYLQINNEEVCSSTKVVLWRGLVLNNYIWVKVDFMVWIKVVYFLNRPHICK
jgi:hypothetical protein